MEELSRKDKMALVGQGESGFLKKVAEAWKPVEGGARLNKHLEHLGSMGDVGDLGEWLR